MTAILDSNQCCRFCGPTPNHSDNGSYIYILRKMRDSNSHNISVTSDFKSGPLPFRQSSNYIFIFLAEAEGFEPSEPFGSAR